MWQLQHCWQNSLEQELVEEEKRRIKAAKKASWSCHSSNPSANHCLHDFTLEVLDSSIFKDFKACRVLKGQRAGTEKEAGRSCSAWEGAKGAGGEAGKGTPTKGGWGTQAPAPWQMDCGQMWAGLEQECLVAAYHIWVKMLHAALSLSPSCAYLCLCCSYIYISAPIFGKPRARSCPISPLVSKAGAWSFGRGAAKKGGWGSEKGVLIEQMLRECYWSDPRCVCACCFNTAKPLWFSVRTWRVGSWAHVGARSPKAEGNGVRTTLYFTKEAGWGRTKEAGAGRGGEEKESCWGEGSGKGKASSCHLQLHADRHERERGAAMPGMLT